MTNLTTTTFDAALKQIYRKKKVEDTTYKRRPAFAMLPKFEGFGGRNMPLVTKYSNPMGRSASFSEAQTNSTALGITDFLLTRVSDYSVAQVDSEAAEASKGDSYAFMSALSAQIDGAMGALADSIESHLYRAGTGSIGAVSTGSTVGNQEITLSDIDDVVNFEVGMTLRGTSTDGGAYDTGEEVLAGINRSTGVLTATSVAWNTVMTNLATSDFLVVSGDAANGGTNVKISGFLAWVPATAPDSTAFFGVDRSVDSRLGGQRHDGSAQLVEEALIDGQSKAARDGGSPDTCLINHAKCRELTKELGSKAQYEQMRASSANGESHIAFRSTVIDGDHGPIKVVPANKCQSTTAWLLQLDTWTCATLGPATKFLNLDGNKILRQASADGLEVRLAYRGNLGCYWPGANCRVALE